MIPAILTRQSMAYVSRSSFTRTFAPASRVGHQQRSYSRTSLNMKLQTAIVGLPNVGKSTLFNALTETQGAEAANYPFCTIVSILVSTVMRLNLYFLKNNIEKYRSQILV